MCTHAGPHLGGALGTTVPGAIILGAPTFCGQKFVYV